MRNNFLPRAVKEKKKKKKSGGLGFADDQVEDLPTPEAASAADEDDWAASLPTKGKKKKKQKGISFDDEAADGTASSKAAPVDGEADALIANEDEWNASTQVKTKKKKDKSRKRDRLEAEEAENQEIDRVEADANTDEVMKDSEERSPTASRSVQIAETGESLKDLTETNRHIETAKGGESTFNVSDS